MGLCQHKEWKGIKHRKNINRKGRNQEKKMEKGLCRKKSKELRKKKEIRKEDKWLKEWKRKKNLGKEKKRTKK